MAMILTSDKKGWEEQSRNQVKKAKYCNSSIDDLADELLEEILQRVPYKAAFRCKSVSKRWLALISEPHFTRFILRYLVQEKRKKLRQRDISLVISEMTEFVVVSQLPKATFPSCLSFLPFYQTSQLLEDACVAGTANGLLLCCSKRHYQSVYYVCRYRTTRWVMLSQAPTSPETALVGLIYDPLDYNPMRLYTSDQEKYPFKVVRLSTLPQELERSAFKVETYSYRTNQWTTSIVSCPRGSGSGSSSVDEFISTKPAIYHNGKLHWYCAIGQVILVYHPGDEKITFMDCPRVAPIHGEICRYLKKASMLSLSCGCLRMSQFHVSRFSDQISRMSVWKLKDYNTGKWSLEHQVDACFASLYNCLLYDVL